jgi:hypothetical protein
VHVSRVQVVTRKRQAILGAVFYKAGSRISPTRNRRGGEMSIHSSRDSSCWSSWFLVRRILARPHSLSLFIFLLFRNPRTIALGVFELT